MAYYKNELYHHGIKGQKWGVRRFENSDGSLTEEGKNRYRKHQTDSTTTKSQNLDRKDKVKKAIKIGATVAAAALVTYGAYKVIGGKVAGMDSQKYYDRGIKELQSSKFMGTLSLRYEDINQYFANSNRGNDVSKALKYMDKSYAAKSASRELRSKGSFDMGLTKAIVAQRKKR